MNLDGWISEYFSVHPPAFPFELIGLLLNRMGKGDGLWLLCTIFGIYAYFTADRKAMRSAGAAVVILTFSGMIVQTLKHLIGRARPQMDLGAFHFIGPNLFKNGFDAFPSGHAMSSFTLAAFFSFYYPRARWALYGIAAAICLMGRVAHLYHFLTDVIVGAALGYVVGRWGAKKFSPWVEKDSGVSAVPFYPQALWKNPEGTGPVGKDLLWIVIFSSFMLFVGMGRSALWDRDETEYAQAVIEMEQSRQWLIPTLEGEPFIEKPILLYWVTYASTKVFGKNEIGFRFPSAMLGVATCLLTYFLGRLLWGRSVGLWSGLILASSLLFAGSFHLLMTDPLFVFFSMTALVFYLASQKKSNSIPFLILSYVSVGLGVLAKGPIGFFPVPVFLLFECLGQPFSLKRILTKCVAKHAALSIIPALISVPWFLYVFGREKQATSSFFLYDNLLRFTEGMEGHTGPMFYYVIVLFLGLLPWPLFFIAAAFQDWRKRVAERTPINRESFLLWCWVVSLFLFFSASANKLPHYILPALPAMACLAAKFCVEQMENASSQLKTIFLWTPALGILLLPLPVTIYFSHPHFASPSLIVPFLLWLVPLFAAQRWINQGQASKSLLALCFASLVLFGSFAYAALPAIEKHRVMKNMGHSIRDKVPPDTNLIGYFVSEPSLFIYGGRRFPKVEHLSLDAILIDPALTYIILPEEWLKSDIPYEIIDKQEGFAENGGEMTLYLIRNKARTGS